MLQFMVGFSRGLIVLLDITSATAELTYNASLVRMIMITYIEHIQVSSGTHFFRDDVLLCWF
jgi:hypothetical protein